MHITVLVSNDLQYDQRVAKVCNTLKALGYEITLVGRLLPESKPFERPYEIKRFRLMFKKGALFYAALNLRLFLFLLSKRTDIILANDLDTLLPAFLAARLKGKKIVYDSHEYFTEAEGLTGRNFQKRTWLAIEQWIFPKLRYVFAVNETVADIYRKKYKVDVKVVRNIPLLSPLTQIRSREELGLPEDKKIILLQGAFIDPDRGGVELVEAMRSVENVLLLIIGAGRDMEKLRHLATQDDLKDKVLIMSKMPFDELRQYTANADLGLSLDRPLHLNYTYSLPNKLFDYIHAGTPVLVSDLPELRRIVDRYKVGMIVEKVEPQALAIAINTALNSPHYEQWKKNCLFAREELNWQKESDVLRSVYTNL